MNDKKVDSSKWGKFRSYGKETKVSLVPVPEKHVPLFDNAGYALSHRTSRETASPEPEKTGPPRPTSENGSASGNRRECEVDID
jgi:hypothetical protein